jgi:hypothetical protein
MRFNEWKTLTMTKLIRLSRKYQDDKKKYQVLDMLIIKLQHLKLRDLGTFLTMLHKASQDIEEIDDIIPIEEEVKQMISEPEE